MAEFHETKTDITYTRAQGGRSNFRVKNLKVQIVDRRYTTVIEKMSVGEAREAGFGNQVRGLVDDELVNITFEECEKIPSTSTIQRYQYVKNPGKFSKVRNYPCELYDASVTPFKFIPSWVREKYNTEVERRLSAFNIEKNDYEPILLILLSSHPTEGTNSSWVSSEKESFEIVKDNVTNLILRDEDAKSFSVDFSPVLRKKCLLVNFIIFVPGHITLKIFTD